MLDDQSHPTDMLGPIYGVGHMEGEGNPQGFLVGAKYRSAAKYFINKNRSSSFIQLKFYKM